MNGRGRNPEPLEICSVNNLFTRDLVFKAPSPGSLLSICGPRESSRGLTPGREPRPSWNPASFRQLFLTLQRVCSLSPGNSYSLISSWNTTQFCLIDMRYTVAIRLWVPQGRVYMLLLGSYVSKLESGTELGVQPTCWTEAKLVYWISLGHLQLVCCAQQTVSVRHTPGSSLFCWSLFMSPNPIQISASLPSQKLLVLSVFHVSLIGNYKVGTKWLDMKLIWKWTTKH